MTAGDTDIQRPTVPVAAIVGVTVLWTGSLGLWRVGPAWPAIACGLAALVLSAALAIWWLLRRRFVAVAVRGRSMEPTFHDGDWLLVRRGGNPYRGQVVVVEHPFMSPRPTQVWLSHQSPTAVAAPSDYGWLVKRVAAVAGDPVPRERVPALAEVPEHMVPPGKLILLGDNQRASFDSRRLGYFSAENVLGVVIRSMSIRRAAK